MRRLKMKDWLFRTEDYICEYALPGGHVKIGETTMDGLVDALEGTAAYAACGRYGEYASGVSGRYPVRAFFLSGKRPMGRGFEIS